MHTTTSRKHMICSAQGLLRSFRSASGRHLIAPDRLAGVGAKEGAMSGTGVPPGAQVGVRESAARYALLPLRIFLGVTFIYAGVDKFTTPGFFTCIAETTCRRRDSRRRLSDRHEL